MDNSVKFPFGAEQHDFAYQKELKRINAFLALRSRYCCVVSIHSVSMVTPRLEMNESNWSTFQSYEEYGTGD